MGRDWRAAAVSTSDRLDFLFLVGQHLVDLLDVAVGQLLHLVGLLAVLVLRDLVIFLGLLQRLHAVASHVAHGDARLLGVFVPELGKLVAPLGRELWQRNADQLAVGLWV